MSTHRSEIIEHKMSHILEIRYSDIDKEKRISYELLEWAKENNDIYVEAFAYTYLGDSYIAQNEFEQSGIYLKEAELLIGEGEEWDKILVRLYSLLGIYYEYKGDEQNSVQYNLNALTVAKRIKDVLTECIVLNNLAQEFQRHNCDDVTIDYLMQAYELQKELGTLPIRSRVISNLGDMYVMKGNLEKAKYYYDECESIEQPQYVTDAVRKSNRCSYYAAAGDREKAKKWARLILEDVKEDGTREFGAFDNYKMLCDGMLKIKEEEYTSRFLRLLEECSIDTLEQKQILKEQKLQFCLTFGSEKSKLEAYREFYLETQSLKKQNNKIIAAAMKDKIRLAEVMYQKNKMQIEQNSLQEQVNLDELTGIYNRRYLEKLTREYAKREDGMQCGVIMADADYFKEYNDYYGHGKGDYVLQAIASCLSDNSGEKIQTCRFGGDEFTCLAEGVTEEEIRQYIELVQKDLYNKNLWHEKSICSDRVTLSIGYAWQKLTEKNGIYHLLQLADEALYDSKLSGRNMYKGK